MQSLMGQSGGWEGVVVVLSHSYELSLFFMSAA